MRRALSASAGLMLLATILVVAPGSAQAQRGPEVVEGDGTAAPSFVTGLDERPSPGPPTQVALSHLSSNESRYHIDDPATDLEIIDVGREEQRSTVRYGQVYEGVPVFGAQYLVHLQKTKGGQEVTSVNGHYFTELDTSVQPRISEDSAERLALAGMRGVAPARVERHGLVVLPSRGGVAAFHFTIWGTSPKGPVKQQIFISAESGVPALSYNDLRLADPALGSGVTAHGDTVELSIFQRDDFVYEMRGFVSPPVEEPETPGEPEEPGPGPMSTQEPVQIVTHDAGGGDIYQFEPTEATVVASSSTVFDGPHAASGAVDAHWGSERVFDFYTALGRNSIDDAGMDIVSVVNAGDAGGTPMYNAFWDGAKMVYGNPEPGTNGEVHPFSADLDIVAHELTHGVIDHTADLVYLNQSGAMNEAYADYFGNAVDVDVSGTPMIDPAAGHIGEDLCRVPQPNRWDCPLRDLNDGTTTEDFVFYLVDYDNGGVHLNSTVFSGALWDIREDLDPAVADKIIYTTLNEYNSSLDDFVDGRNAIEAATDALVLSGEIVLTPEQRQVIDTAFHSRGIVEGWDDAAGNSDALSLIEDVAPLGFYFSSPQVSGSRYVASHYADKTTMFEEAQDILVGNVNGSGTRTRVNQPTFDTLYDEQPDISGEQIVWGHGTVTGNGNIDFDIQSRKLGNGVRTVRSTPGIEWFPSIDGSLVAWEFWGSAGTDIYARRLGKLPKRITSARGDELFPQVAGTKIAWWDLGTYTRAPRIAIKDFKTGVKTTIKAPNPSAYLGPPALNDNFVFWFQDSNNDGVGSIMRAKHNGKKKKALVKGNTEISPVYDGLTPSAPRLSANNKFVAYTDEYGYDRAGDPDFDRSFVGRDVWIVPAGGGVPHRVTCNRGDQAYPAIGNNQRTVWLDGAQGRTDLMTRARPPIGCRRGD